MAMLRSWAWAQAPQYARIDPNELHQKPRHPGEDEIEAERQSWNLEAGAHFPQEGSDPQVREGFVHRRGMDLFRGWHHAVGIGHAPGKIRRHPIVPIAGELAADPPNPVAHGKGNAHRVGDVAQRRIVAANLPEHAGSGDDKSPVPSQAVAGKTASRTPRPKSRATFQIARSRAWLRLARRSCRW